MKELFTKRFWQDVKKTFDQAREGSVPHPQESKADNASPEEPASRASDPESNRPDGAGP